MTPTESGGVSVKLRSCLAGLGARRYTLPFYDYGSGYVNSPALYTRLTAGSCQEKHYGAKPAYPSQPPTGQSTNQNHSALEKCSN